MLKDFKAFIRAQVELLIVFVQIFLAECQPIIPLQTLESVKPKASS